MNAASLLTQAVALPKPDRLGQWTGRLRLSSRGREDNFEATEELLGYFSSLAATGAFAGSIDHIRDSRFDLNVVSRGQRFEAHIHAKNLHPGIWRILLQMLAHCHSMEPYDELALVEDRAHEAPSSLQAEEPALSQSCPPMFVQSEVHISSVADADAEDETLSLTATCGRKLLGSELHRISSLVDDWGSLVYTGAFTPVSEPIDSPVIDKPKIVRQGWSAFEVSIGYWLPNPDALAVLINLLVAMKDELSVSAIERD